MVTYDGHKMFIVQATDLVMGAMSIFVTPINAVIGHFIT
jgi:hypothetical protein